MSISSVVGISLTSLGQVIKYGIIYVIAMAIFVILIAIRKYHCHWLVPKMLIPTLRVYQPRPSDHSCTSAVRFVKQYSLLILPRYPPSSTPA